MKITAIPRNREIQEKLTLNGKMDLQIAKPNRRRWPLHLTSVIFVIVQLIIVVNSQERQPTTGIKFANSYVAGSVGAVNVSNGDLVLSLPLASLPAGRGTSPGAVVTMQYNSKLYANQQTTYSQQQMIPADDMPPIGENYSYYSDAVAPNEGGGWSVHSGYMIRWKNRLNVESPETCLRGDPPAKVAARWKMQIDFPDGTVREFVPALGYTVAFEGYFNIDFSGKRTVAGNQIVYQTCTPYENTTQVVTTGMTYISTDGSRMRLFIPYVANREPTEIALMNSNWQLYALDGTMIENKPTDDSTVSQRVTDRNGNKVEYKGNQIIDQLGRSITLNWGSNNFSGVTVKGVNGESLTTTVIWASHWVYHRYLWVPWGQPMEPSAGVPQRYADLIENHMEVQQITLPTQAGGQSYTFDYYADNTAPNAQSPYTNGWGEMKSVTLPTGAKTTFTYSDPGQGIEVTAADILTRAVVQKELTHTETYDGVQTLRTENTSYATGQIGSDVITPDGASSSENKLYYYNVPSAWDTGMAYKSTGPDGSFSEKIWKSNFPGQGSIFNGVTSDPWGSANAFVKTEFNTITNAAGQPYLTAIKDYTQDKNGNLTQVVEYDWVNYSSVPRDSSGKPTSIPSSAPVKRITTNEYYNQAPNWDSTTTSTVTYNSVSSPKLKNVLKSTTITDGSGTPFSRVEYTYDDPNNLGNLTQVKTWDSSKGAYSNPLTSGNSISVSSTYDSYGNVTSATDARGVVSTMTYGSIPNLTGGSVSGLYPTQAVTAAGLPEQRTSATTYDFSTGLAKTLTDVDNGITSETVYDAIGRPIIAKVAVGTANESWTTTEYNDVLQRVVVRSDLFTKNDGKKVAIQHFDQLGRVRLGRTLEDSAVQSPYNEADGIKVQTRYKFDNPTNPASSNGSYQLTSNPYRSYSDPEMGWSVSYTDKTGRVSTAKTYGGAVLPAPWGSNTNITGTSTTQKDGNALTATDPAGKQGRSISNALGQLIRVDEPDDNNNLGAVSSPIQPTSYQYDGAGNMVKVTQGVQSRFFKYDGLGRLVRVKQPEQGVNPALAMADPATGNSDWSAGFVYDANGNLTSAQDTRGIIITSAYDNLNRVLSRTYSDGTPAVTYTYDNPALQFSKGKLTRVTNSVSTSQIMQFSNLGQVLAAQQITDGVAYNSGYTYNLGGALVNETYPDGSVVTNQYRADGQLAQITGLNGGVTKTYADSISYNQAGAIQSIRVGNNKWETAQFNNRFQVTQLGIGNSLSDTSIWKLNYDFGTTDNNGNIKSQTTTAPGLNPFVQTFTYDSVNRLKTAQETTGGTQTWSQTFTYDRYGNRIGLNQVKNGQTYNYTPTVDVNTNRFTTGQGYIYDLAGNLIGDTYGNQFFFNGDNKQREVRNSQNQTVGQYFYDGDGKRIKKITPTETTVFVYSGGKLVMELTATGSPQTTPQTQYVGTDMLGSIRVITDQAGNVISRRDFMPFGEDIQRTNYGTDNVRQKFTGYQKDNETGLDFAEARYYNNFHGRFTAVDPLLASGKSGNPQTFNRYAYSLNNPINLSDPSGMQVGNATGPVYRDGKDFVIPGSAGPRPSYERFRGMEVTTGQDGNLYQVRSSGWRQIDFNAAVEESNRYDGFFTAQGKGILNTFPETANQCLIGDRILNGNPVPTMGFSFPTISYSDEGSAWVGRISGLAFTTAVTSGLGGVAATAEKSAATTATEIAATATNLDKASRGVTVVGETMARVEAAASRIPNSVTLNNMPKVTGNSNQITSQMMTYNRQWFMNQLRSDNIILHLGGDPNRVSPSIFYQTEQAMTRAYLKLHPDQACRIRGPIGP